MNSVSKAAMLFLVTFFSCSDKELMTEEYESGKLKSECEVVKGKRNGKCTEYFENGNVKSITYWAGDLLHGFRVFNDSTGELLQKAQFVKGNLSGILENYKDGKLSTRHEYQNDKANGKFEEFYPSGSLKTEGWFSDGNASGIYSYYSEENMLLSKREYFIIDGKSKINQYWSFDKNGSIDSSKSNFMVMKEESGGLYFQLGAGVLDDDELSLVLEGGLKYPMKNNGYMLNYDQIRKVDTLRGFIEKIRVYPSDTTLRERHKIDFAIPIKSLTIPSTS